MRTRGSTLFGTLSILAFGLLAPPVSAVDRPSPPVTERRPVMVETHGVRRTDEYGWLRSEEYETMLERPEALERAIRAHLEAENRYARSVLAPNRELERRLIAEMRGRMSQNDESVPEAWGPYEYSTRYPEGSQRRQHVRRPIEGGAEQVLLDENVLAQGRRAFSVSQVTVSPDHKLLAYATDEDGSERNTLKVRDLATGRDLADKILEVRGTAVWSMDGQWLFYVGRDPTKWGQKVFRHRIGTSTNEDQLVYEEQEEGFSVSLRLTLSDRYLVIESGDFSTTDTWVLDLAAPTGDPRPIVERKVRNKQWVTNVGDRLILLTNADGAADWKIAEKLVTEPASAPLRVIVPHQAGRVIEDMVALRDHLVWLERDRERGTQRILVRRWSDGAEHEVGFGEAPGKVELQTGLQQGTRKLRYTYQSMAQPSQVIEYDLETRERKLLKVDDVPSGHDPSLYVTRRLLAPAQDGTQVPFTVLYRQRHQARRLGPGLALRLWRLRRHGISRVRRRAPVAGRSRLHLCDRACARRRREGPAVARGRPARHQDEHLHRLHRRRRAADPPRLHARRTHRGLRRLGRRTAGGRGRQHAPRPVRCHLCRGALRRRAQHPARPLAAADRVRASRSSATPATACPTSATS